MEAVFSILGKRYEDALKIAEVILREHTARRGCQRLQCLCGHSRHSLPALSERSHRLKWSPEASALETCKSLLGNMKRNRWGVVPIFCLVACESCGVRTAESIPLGRQRGMRSQFEVRRGAIGTSAKRHPQLSTIGSQPLAAPCVHRSFGEGGRVAKPT